MRIIPAIDLIDGQCVRLSQGSFTSKTTYPDKPLEVAKSFEAVGLKYLHLVDLDGARSGKVVNKKTLLEITSNTNLVVDFGGGLKTMDDVKKAFDCGAQQLNFGSIAVKNPEFFLSCLSKYGAEKIILSADSLNGMVAISGWEEQSSQSILPFVQNYCEQGVQHITATDINKDGMLAGPAFELYSSLIQNSSAKIVASGGISKLDDLKKLREIGCEGAIVGKAIYEGKISLDELVTFERNDNSNND